MVRVSCWSEGKNVLLECWTDGKSVLLELCEERLARMRGRASYWSDGKSVLQFRCKTTWCICVVGTANSRVFPFSLLLSLGNRASRQRMLVVREADTVW